MIPATMNTAILTAFGGADVVRIAQRPIPALKPDAILIRNRAATVNSGDARIRAKNVPKGYGFLMSMMFGFSKPARRWPLSLTTYPSRTPRPTSLEPAQHFTFSERPHCNWAKAS